MATVVPSTESQLCTFSYTQTQPQLYTAGHTDTHRVTTTTNILSHSQVHRYTQSHYRRMSPCIQSPRLPRHCHTHLVTSAAGVWSLLFSQPHTESWVQSYLPTWYMYSHTQTVTFPQAVTQDTPTQNHTQSQRHNHSHTHLSHLAPMLYVDIWSWMHAEVHTSDHTVTPSHSHMCSIIHRHKAAHGHSTPSISHTNTLFGHTLAHSHAYPVIEAHI